MMQKLNVVRAYVVVPLCCCSMTGSVDALQHALRLVSKQIRENPPKEMPNPLPAASAVAGKAASRLPCLQCFSVHLV